MKNGRAEAVDERVLRGALLKIAERGQHRATYDLALAESNAGFANEQTFSILKTATREVLGLTLRKMGQKVLSDQPEDWEASLVLAEDAKDLIDATTPYLPQHFDEDLILIADHRSTQRNRLYSHYLDSGEQFMDRYENSKLKKNARQAHRKYEYAKQFVDQTPDSLRQRLRSSYQLGTVIYNVDIAAFSLSSYSISLDWIFDDLEQKRTFKHLYFDDSFVEADCNIELDFDDPQIEDSEDDDEREYSKKVVERYETETDTSGNITEIPIYETVYGTVNEETTTRTIRLRLRLDIQFPDENCDLQETTFSRSTSRSITRTRTSGDERAIPERYRDSFGLDEEFDDEEMVEELVEELYEAVERYLTGGL